VKYRIVLEQGTFKPEVNQAVQGVGLEPLWVEVQAINGSGALRFSFLYHAETYVRQRSQFDRTEPNCALYYDRFGNQQD
jgi:hypothetical protein